MRDASRRRIAGLFARLATKQIAPHSTAPKGLHEKCPAAALRDSSNRTSVRPSSRALHLSTFRANAAPSGFCISLLKLHDLAGIEQIVRIERLLDRAHHRHSIAVLGSEEV